MIDETEALRRKLCEKMNTAPLNRQELEIVYGQVWDTQQLGNDFSVQGFMAPFVVVKRKSDNAVGSLMFQHMPRFYFNFTKD